MFSRRKDEAVNMSRDGSRADFFNYTIWLNFIQKICFFVLVDFVLAGQILIVSLYDALGGFSLLLCYCRASASFSSGLFTCRSMIAVVSLAFLGCIGGVVNSGFNAAIVQWKDSRLLKDVWAFGLYLWVFLYFSLLEPCTLPCLSFQCNIHCMVKYICIYSIHL